MFLAFYCYNRESKEVVNISYCQYLSLKENLHTCLVGIMTLQVLTWLKKISKVEGNSTKKYEALTISPDNAIKQFFLQV